MLEPPGYDPRNLVNLLNKYGDAHLSDSKWKEMDPEEWLESGVLSYSLQLECQRTTTLDMKTNLSQ